MPSAGIALRVLPTRSRELNGNIKRTVGTGFIAFSGGLPFAFGCAAKPSEQAHRPPKIGYAFTGVPAVPSMNKVARSAPRGAWPRPRLRHLNPIIVRSTRLR